MEKDIYNSTKDLIADRITSLFVGILIILGVVVLFISWKVGIILGLIAWNLTATRTFFRDADEEQKNKARKTMVITLLVIIILITSSFV